MWRGAGNTPRHTVIRRMELVIFQSEKDAEVFGVTADVSGTNLPDEFAPWRKVVNARTGRAKPFKARSVSSEHIAQAVERDGYYLARSPGASALIRQVPEFH